MPSRSSSLPVSTPAAFVFAALAAWALAVAAASASGVLEALVGVPFAVLVGLGILVPTVVALGTAGGRRISGEVGLYPLTVLHAWRVPAGLLFLWYGSRELLPPAFWVPAGVGDVLVGVYALGAARGGWQGRDYRRFHALGFADFIIAVGSGLAHTLVGDPRIGALASLPLALIPLFGVGVSGASHLVAFWLLRTRAPHTPPAGRARGSRHVTAEGR